jgi:hypothetical protein
MQKNPDHRGCLCSLQGIKIHFREFLYNFALKRNKLLDPYGAGFREPLRAEARQTAGPAQFD